MKPPLILGSRPARWRNQYSGVDGPKARHCGNTECQAPLSSSEVNLCHRCEQAVSQFWRELGAELRRGPR